MFIDDSFIYSLSIGAKRELAIVITSPGALDRLANDEDPDVRWVVARNPNALPEALERLANDEDWAVRCGVAKNPNYKKPNTNQITNEQLVAIKSLIESASSPHLQELLKNAD